jgi:hypothetical protein
MISMMTTLGLFNLDREDILTSRTLPLGDTPLADGDPKTYGVPPFYAVFTHPVRKGLARLRPKAELPAACAVNVAGAEQGAQDVPGEAVVARHHAGLPPPHRLARGVVPDPRGPLVRQAPPLGHMVPRSGPWRERKGRPHLAVRSLMPRLCSITGTRANKAVVAILCTVVILLQAHPDEGDW